MSKLSNALIFVSGCAVGVVATYQYFNKKYEENIAEDRESMRQAIANIKSEGLEEAIKAAEAAKEKPELSEYTAKLQENGYTNYSAISSDAPEKEEPDKEEIDKPYVISPDDFGEFDYYNQISLTYYADGVLTEGDEIIEDVDDIVGEESLNHFGEYEDDSVHVRNDRLKCDYEILWDNRNYSDVVKSKPRPIELEDQGDKGLYD